MNRQDDLNRKFDKLHISTAEGTDNRILEDAFEELDKSMQIDNSGVEQKAWQRNRRNRVMGFVGAAVGIIVMFALLFGIPSAKAVSLAEIYQAVEKVRNVCVFKFRAGNEEPYQRQWISQTLNIMLLDNKGEFVLFDYNRGQKKTKYPDEDTVSVESISQENIEQVKNNIERNFNLLPFSRLSQVREDAQWTEVDLDSVNTVIPGTEVYDLTWTGIKSEFTTLYIKWRVFVDIKTDLPVRAEWYHKTLNKKMKSDEDFSLQTFSVVIYPTEVEILTLIEDIFGQARQQVVELENPDNPQPLQLDPDTNQ